MALSADGGGGGDEALIVGVVDDGFTGAGCSSTFRGFGIDEVLGGIDLASDFSVERIGDGDGPSVE